MPGDILSPHHACHGAAPGKEARLNRCRRIAAAVVCLVLLSRPDPSLSAQVVEVRVVQSVRGTPAPSAIVALRRADGALVEHRLTDLQGRVRFTGMGTGTFRLEADLIGARRAVTPEFAIETTSDTIQRRLRMVATTFVLPEVNVVSRDVACDIGGVDGPDLVRVWEEARKALTATVLTEDLVQPLVQRWRWIRVLDRNQRERGEQTNLVEYTRRPPFVSVSAERLRDDGYIVLGDSLDTFHAPDSRVLLEEEFLETHCFRLDVESRRDEGLVGLRFAPLSERRVPEVEGTLWLRRRGAELAEVTFQYVNLPREFRGNPQFGGRVVFASVPGVGWIVRAWSVQTPIYGWRSEDGALTDGGGSLSGRSWIAARRSEREALEIVRWHLEGGTAHVMGEGNVLSSPLAGASGGDGIPDAARPRPCRASTEGGNGLGAVMIEVVREDSGYVIPSVPVLVVVGDAEVQSVRLVNDRQLSVVRAAVQVEGTADSAGRFAVCGIPVGARVRVHAGSAATPPVHAAASDTPQPVRVGYRVEPPRPAVPAGVLHGRVSDSVGVGLGGVQVVLPETGRLGTTDSTGWYRIHGIPEGRFEVLFRRLGYRPTHTFRAFRQDTSVVNMQLAAEVFVLPDVEVRGRGPADVPQKLREWARRREFNVGGKFWDDSLLRTKEYQRLPEVPQGIPSVRIIRASGGRFLASARGSGVRKPLDPRIPAGCYVEVLLDGARLSSVDTPVNLDDIPVRTIAAMELYRSISELPIEFQWPGSGCGVLAIWTR